MKAYKQIKTTLCLLALAAGLAFLSPAGADPGRVTVFAAASTTNAITDIAQMYKSARKTTVRLSFASSSTLAKQIENGAPADVYLSANPKWMNYLSKRDAIIKSSRTDLLSNRIVLIAPDSSSIGSLTADSSLDLNRLLGDGRLAMGDPDHVPAGMYGKKALENLGLWDSIKDRIARTKDVRAALVLVERKETPLGQVYATDAAISTKVKVVGIFPQNSHPPIVYPVAIVTDNPAAKDFLDFIKSEKAAAVFKKYGFSLK